MHARCAMMRWIPRPIRGGDRCLFFLIRSVSGSVIGRVIMELSNSITNGGRRYRCRGGVRVSVGAWIQVCVYVRMSGCVTYVNVYMNMCIYVYMCASVRIDIFSKACFLFVFDISLISLFILPVIVLPSFLSVSLFASLPPTV